jgi:hypothetical protein
MFRTLVGSRATAAAATVLVSALGACSGDPATDPTTPPSSPASATASPSPTVPAYLEPYSEGERSAYLEAVAAYAEITAKGAEFEEAGVATVAAKEYYQRYTTDWRTYFGTLGELANTGVRVVGRPKARSEKPMRIDVGAPQGKVVVVKQCLDSQDVKVMQGEKELPQPQFEHPTYATTTLVMRRGEDWWRAGIAEQGKRC